jgi:hypothetical protein
MSNTDRLQIFIEDYVIPSTEASLTAVRVRLDNTNTLLDVLTAKQTTVNLDVSAINVNTDQVESLLSTTNTLLTELTSFTFYGVTSSAPIFINQGNLDASVDSVSISSASIDNIANILQYGLIQQTTSTNLSSRFLKPGTTRVYNVFGISTGISNQYIQFYNSTTPTGTPIAVFFVPANSNFSFDISHGLFFADNLLIVNSLTPIIYTQGDNDLFITAIYS